MTNKLCLIGQNISHSKSPELYNSYFKAHSLDYEYFLQNIKDNELDLFINNLDQNNIIAFNVTMPYKSIITKYIDEFDEISSSIKNCNLVIHKNEKLYGYSTDGIGLVNFIKSLNVNINKKIISIIGLGCAGKSIAVSLEKLSPNKINIIGHDDVEKMINNSSYLDCDISNKLINSDIIINASNAGFDNPNIMPLPKECLDKVVESNSHFIFIDIIYNPKETSIMKYLKSKGVNNVYNGEGMLYYQFLENLRILNIK